MPTISEYPAADLARLGFTILRFSSHRARERSIGRNSKYQAFYSAQFQPNTRYAKGGFYAVPDALAGAVLRIPGVTRARAPYDDLCRCH